MKTYLLVSLVLIRTRSSEKLSRARPLEQVHVAVPAAPQVPLPERSLGPDARDRAAHLERDEGFLAALAVEEA